MDEEIVERARERVRDAAAGRPDEADVAAALERARSQIEELAATAGELSSTLPDSVGAAIRAGVREEALPVARQLAEVRGLMNQVLRRLERIEGDALAERNARVDDLALLVDLIVAGWESAERRLERIEERLGADGRAVVYRMDERRPSADAG
jgi:type II secretory pathway component PulM